MKVSIIFTIFILFSSCAQLENKSRYPAHAEGFNSCWRGIRSFFNATNNEEDRALNSLIDNVDPNSLPNVSSLSNRSDLFFYQLISENEAIMNLLQSFPLKESDQKIWFKKINAKIPNFPSTSLSNYVYFIQRKSLNREFDVPHFFSTLDHSLKELNSTARKILLQEVESVIEGQMLQKFYSKEIYATIERDGEFLIIENEKFPFIQNKEEIIVTVPREKIKSPAWNPLVQKQVMGVINNNVAPPKIYDTTLGLDGNFYLLDGNHRFHFRETKSFIKVRISDFKTCTLSIFLDLIGFKQLDQDTIKLIYQHEKDVKDVLPKKISDSLKWSNFSY